MIAFLLTVQLHSTIYFNVPTQNTIVTFDNTFDPEPNEPPKGTGGSGTR